MKGQVRLIGGVALPRAERVVWWRRVWGQVRRWRQLARQRHELAALSDSALKDIGLSRADIWVESHRPFWDDR